MPTDAGAGERGHYQDHAATPLSWRSLLAGIAAAAGAGYFLYAATIHEFPPAGFVYGGPQMVINPAAWQDFLVGVFFIVVNAAGLVAAIGVWRERRNR